MKAADLKKEVTRLIDAVIKRRQDLFKTSSLEAIRYHEMGVSEQAGRATNAMVVAKECDAVVGEMQTLKTLIGDFVHAEGDNLGGP